MKKPSLLLLTLGVISLLIGGVMALRGGPPAADAQLAQACRTEMARRNADASMIQQCDEAAFATAMTATDANDAARSISAANNSEVGSNALAMFLIGVGVALLVAGILLRRKEAGVRA
jgi:hypothetical protein